MRVRIAICQTLARKSLDETLAHVRASLQRAKNEGADLAILGEMFPCVYSLRKFGELSGEVPLKGEPVLKTLHPLAYFLSSVSKELSMWIVGGSIPESDQTSGTTRIYNTATVFDSDGFMVGKYRKLHMFNVSIPTDKFTGTGGIQFRESDTITAGDLPPCLVSTPWGFDIGVGICYDLRFPELADHLRSQSSDRMKLLIYPGAFNMTTGPLHWELLGRARAVDTQSFCVLASVARSHDPSEYQAFGHSMVVSPMGSVLLELGHKEEVGVIDIDMSEVDEMRRSIPTFQQKRSDIQFMFGISIKSWMKPRSLACNLMKRSSLYMRSEIMYMLPGMKAIESRRECILEALERSKHETDSAKQFSGFGLDSTFVRRGLGADNVLPHIFDQYKQVDEQLAAALVDTSQESFPIKRLYNICQTFSNVWAPRTGRGNSSQDGRRSTNGAEYSRGPFPYVDDRATVLSELTKSTILHTRHRVNSDSHPIWALRTIRRRHRKVLVKAKKRSISQEATRELQMRLLSAKSSVK